MPAMANITVKAANGTTDVVFTALSQSSGDGNPALWRQEDSTKVPGHRIIAEIRTLWNGPRDARRAIFSLRAPIVQATAVAGVNEKVGEIRCDNGNWIVPQNAPAAFVADVVAYGQNLQSSALIKSVVADGFAPT